MAEQRFKGSAGKGARGKNRLKNSQTKPARRRQKYPKLAKAKIKGVKSGSRAKRNQARNQRSRNAARKIKARRTTRVAQAA